MSGSDDNNIKSILEFYVRIHKQWGGSDFELVRPEDLGAIGSISIIFCSSGDRAGNNMTSDSPGTTDFMAAAIALSISKLCFALPPNYVSLT
jgi:hypothetical protein